jgi:hypothetical protein
VKNIKNIWIALLFIISTVSGYAQEASDADRALQKEINGFFEKLDSLSRVEILQEMWQLQTDEVANKINAKDEKELHELEEMEIAKLIVFAYRLEVYDQFKQNSTTPTGLKVAFLGFSGTPFQERGFDSEVLGALLDGIKQQKPDALFFTGNFIWSLKIPQEQDKDTASIVHLSPRYSDIGQLFYEPVGIYDSQLFSKQLERFATFLKQHLGSQIPIYPLMGEMEAVGPDSLEIFQKQFPLENSSVLSSGQLVYTVKIGDADFVAVSFPAYDKASNAPIQEHATEPLLSWMDETLKNLKNPKRYLFVVGNEPAFSTNASSGVYSGLDRNRDTRTQFWHLLMRYKVTAYLCSNEPLFDLSYRYGVWQIISGGGGVERDVEHQGMYTFHHWMMLTLPSRFGSPPLVSVYGADGKKKQEDLLSPQATGIFQFRR